MTFIQQGTAYIMVVPEDYKGAEKIILPSAIIAVLMSQHSTLHLPPVHSTEARCRGL